MDPIYKTHYARERAYILYIHCSTLVFFRGRPLYNPQELKFKIIAYIYILYNNWWVYKQDS